MARNGKVCPFRDFLHSGCTSAICVSEHLSLPSWGIVCGQAAGTPHFKWRCLGCHDGQFWSLVKLTDRILHHLSALKPIQILGSAHSVWWELSKIISTWDSLNVYLLNRLTHLPITYPDSLWCSCSVQSDNLRNLEIALRILRIPRLRFNLEIVQHVCTISRLRDLHAQSINFELCL